MTEWGPPIPVNGKRPKWLRDDDYYERAIWGLGASWGSSTHVPWSLHGTIRLPINHPASICQQRALDHPDEKPFYPVHADGTVPMDYDGGDVLRRSGTPGFVIDWQNDNDPWDVFGYRRKVVETCNPEQFAGVISDPIQRAKELIGAGNDTLSEAARQCNISKAWHILDRLADTHVLVERMTLGKFANKWGWSTERERLARDLGIIKPDPDPIADYAAKHSLDLTMTAIACQESAAIAMAMDI